MKKVLILKVCILTTVLLTSFILSEWTLFEDEFCSVLFPSKPKRYSLNKDENSGVIKSVRYTSSAKWTELMDSIPTCSLIEEDYSFENSQNQDSVKSFWKKYISNIVEIDEGRELLSEQDISQNGHYGKEIKISGGTSYTIVQRAYLIKSKVIAVDILVFPGMENSTNALKFLSSLKLK